jgi:hypothetical protein
MLIIINCFTVSVTFLILQIFYLNLPHGDESGFLKWETLGSLQAKGHSPSSPAPLLLKQFLFTAKLLAIDFAIESF